MSDSGTKQGGAYADTMAVEQVHSPETEHGYDIPLTMSHGREEVLINDRYRVLNALGKGGFATVYRGVDENLGRSVAIKIMRSDLLDRVNREAFLNRFKREAFVVANLDHPNLVPVYETGTVNFGGKDVAFIVMKQLVGEDLEAVLGRVGALEPERMHRVMGQVLEALSYVHSKGIVHKDLKPSNIFVSEDHLGREHAYLMDFGIAHDERDTEGRMTQTGMLTGTFQYLPPEYILEHQATAAVDVFQMGMVVAELLTGTPVNGYDVTLPHIVARYLKMQPYELHPRFNGTRGGSWIQRALAYDLGVRHTNAGEMLAEFVTLTPADFPDLRGLSSEPVGPLQDTLQDTLQDRSLERSSAPMLAMAATDVDVDPRRRTNPGEVRAEDGAEAPLVYRPSEAPTTEASLEFEHTGKPGGDRRMLLVLAALGVAIFACSAAVYALLPRDRVADEASSVSTTPATTTEGGAPATQRDTPEPKEVRVPDTSPEPSESEAAAATRALKPEPKATGTSPEVTSKVTPKVTPKARPTAKPKVAEPAPEERVGEKPPEPKPRSEPKKTPEKTDSNPLKVTLPPI